MSFKFVNNETPLNAENLNSVIETAAEATEKVRQEFLDNKAAVRLEQLAQDVQIAHNGARFDAVLDWLKRNSNPYLDSWQAAAAKLTSWQNLQDRFSTWMDVILSS